MRSDWNEPKLSKLRKDSMEERLKEILQTRRKLTRDKNHHQKKKSGIVLFVCQHIQKADRGIQCIDCKMWAHEECTKGSLNYVCHNCDSE